jgi:hypothetical protein
LPEIYVIGVENIPLNSMDMQRWAPQIDSITKDFKTEFGNLTGSQLNWKPNATTWSVAQNLDHLIVINKTYYPIIQQIRQNSYEVPWIGRISFMVNFIGKMILNSVRPDRKRKMKTFPLWEPSTSNISSDILERFEKHQSELKQLIDDCSDLLAKGAVISSPANKHIVYKLETAFDIIVTHERRHFEQAKEVRNRQPAGKP